METTNKTTRELAIKQYNEEIHIDLIGDDLYTLDESEIDDFEKWLLKSTSPTETVEQAARKQYKNVGYDGSENSIGMYISGAEFGANWQKQQSQKEIDKLKELNRELVEVLDKIYKIEDKAFSLKSFDVKMFKTLIEYTLNKAKNI